MNKAGTPPPLADLDLLRAEEPSFDLKAFLGRYVLRYWWLYLLALALAFGSLMLYLRYTTPLYDSSIKLLIRQPAAEVGASQELLLQDLGFSQGSKNLMNEIEILKSRTLMRQVVDKLNLNIIYLTEGRIRTSENYRNSLLGLDTFALNGRDYGHTLRMEVISRDSFNLVRGETREMHAFGEPFTNNSGVFQVSYFGRGSMSGQQLIRIANPDDVARGYAKRLRITIVEGYSDVLQIMVRDEVPEKGKDILNTLVDVYNQAAIDDKNRLAENTLKFINERLIYLTRELSDVESDIEEYKRRNEIATDAGGQIGVIYGELRSLEEEIIQIEIQLDILESLEDYLLNDANYDALIPFSSGVVDAGLNNMIVNYNQLLLERERLLRSAGTENPVIIQIEKEIAAERNFILQSLRSIKREMQTNLRALEDRNEDYLDEFRDVPRKERELVEINRQQQIKEQLYLYLLERREETALSMAVTVPNSRLIDPAISNGNPVEPNEKLLYVMALFLGVSVPAISVLLRELMRDTVQSEDDIKAATRTPLLGGVAFSPSKQDIVVRANSRSAAAEMFRLLRTNLQYYGTGEGTKTILITSGSSSEGKSFITANLGVSLALAKKKVVLLGLDLRKPKLAAYLLSHRPKRGITNYLIEEAEVEDILIHTEIHPNLSFIPSGPIPPNPAELIIDERLEKLMETLKADYDYILIDSPPIGMVTDAFLLNAHVTSSIYVVRFGKTKKASLRLIEDIFQEDKLTRPSIVFNGFRRGKGRYGYGYGYGYGYYVEDAKKGKWWRIWRPRKKH